jgi:hypothetical protein
MDKEILDSLVEKYAAYSDEQIMEILKKQKYYQPEAAKIAIDEAIRRGIIRNEDDLLAPGFRHTPRKFSLFPEIERIEAREKLIRSMARIILFIGFLPIIYGVLKIADRKTFEAAMFIGFGILWVGLSLLILKKPKPFFIYSIFILSIASVGFAIKLFSGMPLLKFADVFVTFVIFGILYYNLVYILILSRRR